MRVVIDTNVFVSAALKDSSWPSVVVRWADKYGVLLKTFVTEKEVMEVLQRPRLASKLPPLFTEKIKRIFSSAETVAIGEKITACRDPKDDKFLELAVNGRADVIISGDADLIALDPFRDIPILDPATFGLAHIARM